MRLTLKEKQAVTIENGDIIDWLVEVAGYNRKYAATLLRNGNKKKAKSNKPSPRTGRPPRFTKEAPELARGVYFRTRVDRCK